MKKLYIVLFFSIISTSCISEEINKGIKTCEEKVEEALMTVDKQCLSKQEILDIIYSIKESESEDANDQSGN
jgi:predicted DNA-binding protein (UPF0278 family)